MNETEIIILASNITVKYIGDILISGKEYYKYESEINGKQKKLYLNTKIDNENKKNEVYEFLLKNENNSSDDLYLDLDISINVNSDIIINSGTNNLNLDVSRTNNLSLDGDIPTNRTINQNTNLSENWQPYIDMALTSIRNTSSCGISAIDNFYCNDSLIGEKYPSIGAILNEGKTLYKSIVNSGGRTLLIPREMRYSKNAL